MNSKIDLDVLKYIKETLPKNKVITYKKLGDFFGVHPRKIASVMKYNKSPDLYPCYKVISNSGKISGYSAYDGINTKIEKLKNDGIEVVDGKIPKKYIF